MLIASLNFKGGQGKSLWTAILTDLAGPEAEILDLDPQQGDAQAWAEKAGRRCQLVWKDAGKVLQAAAASDQWFVSDCPPHEGPETRAALHYAQVVVIPVVPSGAQDARAWGRMQSALKDARVVNPNLKVAAVLNSVRPTAISRQFVDLLKEWHSPKTGQCVIGAVPMRVGISEAYAAGQVPKDPAIEDATKKLRAFLKN